MRARVSSSNTSDLGSARRIDPRVAIARALANRPSLLLADEPTGELDQSTGGQIASLFDRLNADGTALVIVTHDPDVAARARRTLRMRDGEIVEAG